jgi:hypothetical protein
LAVRGQFDPLFVYLAVPFVMYGFMLSLSLEAPDAEIDQKGGKRNFVVRKGERKVFLFILALTTSATSTFLTYKWLITSVVLDFGVLALFSIVPLTSAFFGFTRVLQKQSANRFSTLNIASLFVFNMLTVAYLIVIMFQS